MKRSVLLIDGHPDPAADRLCHALVDAYAEGAGGAGHDVEVIRAADTDIHFLRSKDQFEHEAPPPAIRHVQQAIGASNHLVFVYPLWLGTMPAVLKALLEQVFRPGFAFDTAGDALWHKQLRGKSARIVVTMGMPALVYRWYFRAHSLKSLERNVLKFCGIKPVRETLFGMVETAADSRRKRWLQTMRELGARGR